MAEPLSAHVARRVSELCLARMGTEPVIALVGPRTVGKSTLLREVAAAHGGTVVDLDDLAVRAAVAADPALFAAAPRPVCLDEYQHVPALLDAIKAELNRDLAPGRFVLAGSTRIEALPRAAQSLTGRLHVLRVQPLAQVELARSPYNFLELLVGEPAALLSRQRVPTSRAEYIDRVVAGGMPLALVRPAPDRGRWFDDYIRLTLERDALDLVRVRQREKLPRLLALLAAQSAQLLNIRRAAAAIALDASTAENYTRLLEAVFLLQRLPAWGRSLRTRTVATPKLHIVDTGVAARLLRLSTTRLAQLDPTALTLYGHLLETFVVWEVIKQASWLPEWLGWGHWRTQTGAEVDLVLEREDGGLVAIEVKAGSQVDAAALTGLRRLRQDAPDRWLAGVVFYGGALAYRIEAGLYALPIDRLWRFS